MNRRYLLAAGSGAAFAALFAGPSQARDMIRITGRYGYRERRALPPGAQGIISLLDVSRMDAAADVLGVVTQPLDGKAPPFAFAVDIDRERLQPNRRYVIRIEIRDAAERLAWTTDQAYPVEPEAGDQDLGEMMLVGVAAPQAPLPLAGTSWRVQSAAGFAAPENAGASVEFGTDGQISGSAGCNRFNGRYRQVGTALMLGALAMTRRACVPELSMFEAAMAGLLSGRLKAAMDGDRLMLTAVNGAILVLIRN